MTGAWPVLAEQELPASMASVEAARALVRGALSSCPEAVVDVARLLVSELVTNAIRGSGQPILVRISAREGQVAVAVRDHAPGTPELRESVADGSDCGRGLRIVETLSTTWGWTAHGAGKTVWFTI
ncbi:MAG TPA: ATP-binding protein [Frankiaceae bacterium]|nr:ATP-binding protein [Frankiaceae bacterium]